MTPSRRLSILTLLSILIGIAIVVSLYLPYRTGRRIAKSERITIEVLLAVHRAQLEKSAGPLDRPKFLPGLGAGGDGALTGRLVGGDLLRDGYRFRIFLANPEGEGVSYEKSVRHGASLRSPYVCYAWPIEWATSGRRAFALLDDGTVLGSENSVRRYSGEHAPRAGAAFRASQADRITDPPAAGTQVARDWGADGQVWSVVDPETLASR